jgi:hypothetical protein
MTPYISDSSQLGKWRFEIKKTALLPINAIYLGIVTSGAFNEGAKEN